MRYNWKLLSIVLIPATGVYEMVLKSDDGAVLFIDESKTIDNDGIHGMKQKRGAEALEKGLHRIRLFYFQGAGGKGLRLQVRGSGMELQDLPPAWLRHE